MQLVKDTASLRQNGVLQFAVAVFSGVKRVNTPDAHLANRVIVNYNVTTMLFEWDPHKAARNLKKHRVAFDLASTVFGDPLHLSIPDPDADDEERWITVGRAADQSTLIVVHTERYRTDDGEAIRIISARKTTKKEKEEYEEGI